MGKGNDSGTVYIGSRISAEKAERVAEIARAEDRSLSSLLRRAIDREIEIFDQREAA
jgi:predicted transcriptional regulator